MEWLSGSSSSAALDRAASAYREDLEIEHAVSPSKDPMSRVEARLGAMIENGEGCAACDVEVALVLVRLDTDDKGISWKGICGRERIRTLGDLDETLTSGEFEGLFPERVSKRLRLARFLIGLALDAREPKLATSAANTGADSMDDLVGKIEALPAMYKARIRNRLRTELLDTERSMLDFSTRLVDDVVLGLRFFVCGGSNGEVGIACAPAEDVDDAPGVPEQPRQFEFNAVPEPLSPLSPQTDATAPDDFDPDDSPVRERRSSSAASEAPTAPLH